MDLYAALDDRVLAVEDGVATEELVGRDLECVAASEAAPGRAFVGTVDSGVQRTTDGGDTWERVSPIEDRVTALAVSPHDPDVVWAGTEPSAVYRSADGGDTWTERPGVTDLPSSDRWSFPPRPHTHHVRWLEPHPTDPDRLYVAIEAGALVRTDDGGETWRDHPAGARRDNHTLATSGAVPERVYTAAGDGYAQSEDGGDTWDYPQSGLDHRYVWGLAVADGDPDTVVVSAASGPRSAHTVETAEAYVYRTTDAGAETDGPRWDPAMDGFPDPEGTVRSVLSSAGDRAFVALNNRGIYRSTDGAASWTRLPVEWSDEYAGTPRGLATV